jgi:choline-glycine betaine transporter
VSVQLQGLAGYILLLLWVAVLATTVYAFVHAAMQRQDAYTAADKLTKPVWLVIIGIAGLLALLFGPGSVFGAAIAAVAAGVYLVDVRPKLLEVQGKSR